MKPLSFLLFGVVLTATGAFAQHPAFEDSLLDHFAGKWVLRGVIAGKQTTHDIDARWILGHLYLQFQETSRERDSTGSPEYEALVTIGWDERSTQYACLWLENTGACSTRHL